MSETILKPEPNSPKQASQPMNKINMENLDGHLNKLEEIEYVKKSKERLLKAYSQDIYKAAFILKEMLCSTNILILSILRKENSSVVNIFLYIGITITMLDSIMTGIYFLKSSKLFYSLSVLSSGIYLASTFLIMLCNILFRGKPFFIHGLIYLAFILSFEGAFLILSKIKLEKVPEEGNLINITEKENEINIEV